MSLVVDDGAQKDQGKADPKTGLLERYYVLSEMERAKGFVRPVRVSYKHVGRLPPRYPLRDLNDVEHAKNYSQKYGYVKFEQTVGQPEGNGRYWTQKELDSINKGCGVVTTMHLALAETYARAPRYYGGTYCAGCHTHLPVGEAGEFVWIDEITGKVTDERVGT